MKALLGILIATFLSACSGPVTDPMAPPAPDDTQAWNARFPSGRWVRAWGESASSRRDAALDAKAQVAEQMRSSISSETTSLARAVMRDTDVTDFQELESQVRSTATFERAELIRTVEATEHEDDGIHRILAVLDRNEVARAIQLDYDEVAEGWRPSAALSGPLPEWSAGWHRCRQGFPAVLAAAAEAQAVSGLYPAGFSADRARWDAVHAARDSVLRATEIVMQLTPTDGVDIGELAERLGAGFARLGVTARTGTCNPGEVSLHLEPLLESRQVIGPILSLELNGTIGPCNAPAWSNVSLSGSAMRGEGRNPNANLMRNITAEALAPVLVESLGHILPF